MGIQKGKVRVWGHWVRSGNGEKGKEAGVGARGQDTKVRERNRRGWTLGDIVE